MADDTKNTAIAYHDYTQPIARTGEQQYACIMRERSGIDAGNIDYGLRDLTHMGDGGQTAVNVIFSLYEAACDQTGLRAEKDQAKDQALAAAAELVETTGAEYEAAARYAVAKSGSQRNTAWDALCEARRCRETAFARCKGEA